MSATRSPVVSAPSGLGRGVWVAIILCAILAAVLGLGLSLGAGGLEPGAIAGIWTGERALDPVTAFRLPRVLVGIGAGAALALAGVLLQAVLRNPLVEPGVLGLNAGAALAAGLLLVFTSGAVLPGALAVAAVVGAASAMVIVVALAWSPAAADPIRLILSGIAIAALAGAALTAITLAGPPRRIQRLMVWLAGNLNGAGWSDVRLVWLTLLAAIPGLAVGARGLDVLMLDRGSAAGLGLRGRGPRYLYLAGAAILAGVATAAAGIIAFVGLVAPHIARQLVGAQARHLLPVAAVLGAVLVAAADLLGRAIDPPRQFPAGLICALIGAPYFFYLMRRRHV